MKVAFYSNFLNHHQLQLCLALHQLTDGQFTFVATAPVPEERRELGYHDMNKQHPFVLTTYDSQENRKKALELAEECDIVIIGSAPKEYLQARMKQKKLCFLYSERLYKQGYEAWKWPVRLVRQYLNYGRYQNLHLLCASAFTAADFAKTGTFIGKAVGENDRHVGCRVHKSKLKQYGRHRRFSHLMQIHLCKRLCSVAFESRVRNK